MFIEIKGRILDEKEYRREVILLKNILELEFKEIMNHYGLEKTKTCTKREFIHENTSLKVKLLFEESEQKPL